MTESKCSHWLLYSSTFLHNLEFSYFKAMQCTQEIGFFFFFCVCVSKDALEFSSEKCYSMNGHRLDFITEVYIL